MRTDVDIHADRLDAVQGFKSFVTIDFYRSRHVIPSVDDTYEASFASSPGILGVPVPQDTAIINNRMVHVYVHNNIVKLGTTHQAVMIPTFGGSDLDGCTYNRPSIVNADGDYFYVFWQENITKTIKRAKVTKSTFFAGTPACINAVDTVASVSDDVSLHAVSSLEVYGLYLSGGGVGYKRWYYAGSWTSSTAWCRMHHPTEVFNAATSSEVASLNYSGVAVIGDRRFIYFTAPDGNVKGVYYETSTESWSQIFEAVAEDLSTFNIANAFAWDGRVFLAGQFQRQDPTGAFSSTYIYNLLLQSRDGITFSLDRNTLVTFGDTDTSSEMACRYFMEIAQSADEDYGVLSPSTIISAFGAWGASMAKYDIEPTNVATSLTAIMSLQGDYNNGWRIRIGRNDFRRLEDLEFADGALVYLSSIDEGGGRDWFLLQECIYLGMANPITDDKVEYTLDLVPWSYGRLQDMTQPFYTEIQGQQAIRDDLDEFDNLYKASEDGYLVGPFAIDFWGEGTVGPKVQDATETTQYWSSDIKAFCSLIEYPEITALPFDIECYGWSRAGGSVNLQTGTGDTPSDPNKNNARVWAELLVENDDTEKYIRVESAKDGTYNYFPQTWKKTSSGSYPVILEATSSDGLAVGDKIKQISLCFTNDRGGTDKTMSFAERIEIPDISMKMRMYEKTWSEVMPTEVDKVVIVAYDNGLAYTEAIDVDTPVWKAWNTDFTDKNNITGFVYDHIRRCYYATGPNGIWKSVGLGESWVLIWDHETAVAKLNAAGHTCWGQPISTEHTSSYVQVFVKSDGTIFTFGGSTNGLGYGCFDYKAIFRSYDGLLTLDPVSWGLGEVHPGHDGIAYVGNFLERPNGDMLAAYMCGWAYAEDSHTVFSDDDFTTYEDDGTNDAWDDPSEQIVEADNNRIIYYKNMTTAWITNTGRYASQVNNFFDHAPDPWGSRPISMYGQLAASPIDRSKLMVSCQFQIDFSSDNGDTWTGRSLPSDLWKAQATHASLVDKSTWFITGQTKLGWGIEGFWMTEDDGVTWTNKTGNYRSIVGDVDIVKICTILAGTPSDEDLREEGQELERIGVPVVYFSTRPYYTVNAEVSAKYFIEGPNAWGGVIVCGHDGKNYITARASPSKIQLVKVRDNINTVLEEEDYDFPVMGGWILLKLHDGTFTVWVRDKDVVDWTEVLTYAWKESDGSLCIEDDISHVGVYALRDAPWIKITGYDPELGDRIGVMPGSSNFSDFPEYGKVRIGDVTYTYWGKTDPGMIKGPYQGRNVSGPWNYTRDGHSYQDNEAEFTLFEWISNSSNWNKYNAYVMAVDTGFAWDIDAVDFKVWISTRGVPIPLRNRVRCFSDEAAGNVVGMSTRVWLTGCLESVARDAGDDTTHPAGELAILLSDSRVILYEFTAASGYEPMTDKRLLQIVCGLSNARPLFPGDTVTDELTISGAHKVSP